MAVNNITADAKNEWFERICVFGGGLMGAGIASVCAFYGRSITVVDMDGKALSQAKQRVHFGLNKMLEAAQEEMPRNMTTLEHILDRVRFTVDLARAVADAQLIIECIPENLEAKKRLLSRIEEHCPRDALLATNTSSLRIADIGHGLRAMEEGRFAGMHFFNPVPKMRLVEVIPSAKMSQQLMSRLVTFVKSIGKEPVICKDTPGFIANRILLTMLSEAIGLVERQVASSEEVDKVCQLGLGLPIGPFRLLDFIGLDTVANIIAGWAQHYQEEYPNLRQSKVLNQLVAEGKLGRKTGQGFYEYGNSNSKL